MSQPNKDSSAPPAKSKSGCGSIIVKGLLVLVVMIAAVGTVVWQRNQAIKRAALEETLLKDLEPPKSMALKAVQSSDATKAELGDPIADKGKLRRAGSGELDRNNAAFSFDVTGPQGAAVVDVTARQADGKWQISRIHVTLASGKKIDVPPPSADAPLELEFGP